MLDTHTVSLRSLEALARGSGDPVVVKTLLQVNRSKQLLLLRAVLEVIDEASQDMGPLPALSEAWTLLVDAQQQNGRAVEDVVVQPRTAWWATETLRRVRTGEQGPPLWAFLGYLHQMAAAAAIRAGLDCRLRVPMWRGAVMLPTLGLAEVRSDLEWDFAEVHASHGVVLVRGRAGSVQIPDDRNTDGAGWSALRRIETGGGALWLDDLDPYREFRGPVPARRLPSDEVARWLDIVERTWAMLVVDHPDTAAELTAGLTTLVPHVSTGSRELFSASHNDAFGAVVLSRPTDPGALAEILVHEFQHSKFGVLSTLIDVLETDTANNVPCLYAPWRSDPRPALGLLHGLVSFLGVTAFYRERCRVETGQRAQIAQFEFAYRWGQVLDATRTLLTEATPSMLGRQFLDAVQGNLEEWAAEPLPHEVRAAAERVNLDHRLCWRLRHLRPPARVVVELADAWSRNEPMPVIAVVSELSPEPGTATRARHDLTRVRLENPARFDSYRNEPEVAMAEFPGATAADLALIGDDMDAAAEAYQREILAGPSPAAWAGLALATGDVVLCDRPELVAAVHEAVRVGSGAATDPVQLAQWLA
jgi:HEXXH motif-containing protein